MAELLVVLEALIKTCADEQVDELMGLVRGNGLHPVFMDSTRRETLRFPPFTIWQGDIVTLSPNQSNTKVTP